MPSLPKKLIDTATDLGRKAASELAGRIRRDDEEPAPSQASPSPEGVGAPKPGAPGAPKSATAKRKPKARVAKVKPSGRGARAKAGPREPTTTANAAAATPTEAAVPTGKTSSD